MSLPERISVIVTTYEQPRALELVLQGYARQSFSEFQLLVADDGSGEHTGAVISQAREAYGLDVSRVWHPDRGFRKTEILNRAIVASHGDYIVFSDGDCIPRDDFVEVHRSLARPRCFLSGGYLKLPQGLSETLTPAEVGDGLVFDRRWLRAKDALIGRRQFRLGRSRRLARTLDAVTPTRATWNGHNASTWSSALREVNGYDMEMGYGGLDRALGERLANAGYRGIQIRHRAPTLHIWHERPYRTDEGLAANRTSRERIRREGIVRAEHGIEELDAGPSGGSGQGPG